MSLSFSFHIIINSIITIGVSGVDTQINKQKKAKKQNKTHTHTHREIGRMTVKISIHMYDILYNKVK